MAKAGRAINLSFYGDIIGTVQARPHEDGYRWMRHPGSSVTDRGVQIGPVIAPEGSDGKRVKPRSPRDIDVKADLYRTFISLRPSLESFRQFAVRWGLLGVTDLPFRVDGAATLVSEPLVLWLQHYGRLRLLHSILVERGPVDRERFFADQDVLRRALQDCFNRSVARLVLDDAKVELDYTSSEVGGRFQPICPTIPRTFGGPSLKTEAMSLLTDQIGQHCRLSVRSIGRRKKLILNDDEDFDRTKTARVIKTSLEPKGLIGAFYIGVLLSVFGGTEHRVVRSGCAICGAPILDPRSNKIYCTQACKHRAKRRRAKGKLEAR